MSQPLSLPKWVLPVALAALLVGLCTVVLGPPLIYAVASTAVDAELSPELRLDSEAVAELTKEKTTELVTQWFWVFPVAGGLGFFGMIALILIWVSRPLGSDLDPSPQAAEDQAEANA